MRRSAIVLLLLGCGEYPDPRPVSHPQVMLLTSEGSSCSSSLIGRRTLLTAAHCVKGEVLVNNQIVEAITHPDFDGTLHDLAVITLNDDANTEPYSLGVETAGLFDLVEAIGKRRKSMFLFVDEITTSQIILRGDPNIEFGDSGGPTLTLDEGVLVGIHTHKNNRGAEKIGIDLNISNHLDWILSAAQEEVKTVHLLEVDAIGVNE